MKKRKSHERSGGKVPDVHLHLGPGTVQDRMAAEDSCQIDAAKDREWLRQHPNANQRERVASVREMLAFNLPAGSTVVVKRGPNGSQMRIFFRPDLRRN